jgi:hypothetical protein
VAAGGDAVFKISIEGNAATVAKDVAASTKKAADAITEYEKEIKSLSADLRRLKGNSEETTAAKAELKKKIDAAKGSVSSLTTALVKQGTTYKQATEGVKKYAEATGKLPNLRKGIGKLGDAVTGTLKPITTKIKLGFDKAFGLIPASAKTAMSAVAEDVGSVLPGIGEALAGVVAGGTTLLVAGLAALVTGAAAAGVALTAFTLKASDAAATMNRQREALYGNADDAKRLGDQINLLAGKVPQGTAELNAMALALEKTHLSGKDIVTTMQAVGQVTGAVDAGAGQKIQELITRGQNTGRFQLQSFRNMDLQGTGLDFEEVAKEYAEGTHKSIEAARKELVMGQATLGAGAEALAKVAEKKFGDINIKNAFSLKNAPTKFFEQLSALASGVDLGPLAKGFQDAFGQLSPDAPLGRGVKAIFDTLGGAFVDIASKAIPALLEGFKWVVAGGLHVINFFYEMRNGIKDAIGEGAGWEGVGKFIILKIADGILGANAFLFDAGKRAVAATIDRIKDTFSGTPKAPGVVEGFGSSVGPAVTKVSQAAAGALNQPGINSTTHNNTEVHIHTDAKGATDLQSPDFLSSLTRAVRDARQGAGVGL